MQTPDTDSRTEWPQRCGRYQAVFEHAALGIALLDLQGRVLDANPAWLAFLGYDRTELPTLTVDQYTVPDPDSRPTLARFHGELLAGERAHAATERRYRRKDGTLVWGRPTVSVVRDAHGQPELVIAMVEDISARKQAEDQLAHLAFHDPLTNLPNRRHFDERLAAAVTPPAPAYALQPRARISASRASVLE